MTNRDELAEVLLPLVHENRLVVVDLTQAVFVDSSIAHLLLGVQEQASAQDHVLRLQMGKAAIVHKVFEVTGALDVLECVSTRGGALTLGT
jgi:anti-anti-sigma factor